MGNWVLLWVIIIEVQVELCIIDFWDLLLVFSLIEKYLLILIYCGSSLFVIGLE